MDDAEDDVQMEVASDGPNSQAVHMNPARPLPSGPRRPGFLPIRVHTIIAMLSTAACLHV